MIEDEDLDKIPPSPMNITSMMEARQARYHFHKMPQVVSYEVSGDTMTFHWLNSILVTVRRAFQTSYRGFNGGRVFVLKVEDTSQDPHETLAYFANGKMEVSPTRGSLAEEICKRVLLSYN